MLASCWPVVSRRPGAASPCYCGRGSGLPIRRSHGGLRDSSTLTSPTPVPLPVLPSGPPLGPGHWELALLPPAGLSPPLHTVLGEGGGSILVGDSLRCSDFSTLTSRKKKQLKTRLFLELKKYNCAEAGFRCLVISSGGLLDAGRASGQDADRDRSASLPW